VVNIRHVPQGRPARKTKQTTLKKSFYSPPVVTNQNLWGLIKGEELGWAVGDSGIIVKIDGGTLKLHPDSGLVNNALFEIDRVSNPNHPDMVAVGANGTLVRGVAQSGAGENYNFSEDPESGSVTTEDMHGCIWLYSQGYGYSAWRIIAVGGAGQVLTNDTTSWSAGSDWQIQETPVSTTLTQVGWAGIPNPVVAVGRSGTIIESPPSTEIGKTWDVVAEPNQVTSNDLKDVSVLGSQDYWLVGSYGTILHHQDGETVKVESPTEKTLWGIRAFGPENIYAVGNNGVILHYDGETWVDLTPPTTNALTDIRGLSVNSLSITGAGGIIVNYYSESVPVQPMNRAGNITTPNPTEVGNKFDYSASANTDIFSSDITASQAGIFRVGVCLASAAVLNVMKTRNGVTKTEALNDGNALDAGDLNLFDVPVLAGDEINFQVESAVTVDELSVQEIIQAGP